MLTTEQMNEFRLLRLRNFIADKEAVICRANNDIAKFGEWRCDWDIPLKKINEQIIEALEKLAENKGVENEIN